MSQHHQFESTRWSLVVAAGHRSSAKSDEALAALCSADWYPLYAYVRRQTEDFHAAQDLTQSFFSRLIETNFIAKFDEQRGRFRTFLLASLKHFLTNEWNKSRAQKRGGGQAILSLNFEDGESRYTRESANDQTAEAIYEREWAITLMDQVLARLRSEFQNAAKLGQFDQLKQFLSGDHESGNYTQAAEMLGMTQNAVQVAVHRMRRRLRDLLRSEIAQTVTDASTVDDEIGRLFRALSV